MHSTVSAYVLIVLLRLCCQSSPYVFGRLPSARCARRVCERSVLVKAVHECWGHGETLEDCIASVQRHPARRMAPFLSARSTFCIRVHAVGHTFELNEQRAMIDRFAFLPVRSALSFTAPDERFWLLFDFGDSERRMPTVGAQPKRVFFCREVRAAQSAAATDERTQCEVPHAVARMCGCRWRCQAGSWRATASRRGRSSDRHLWSGLLTLFSFSTTALPTIPADACALLRIRVSPPTCPSCSPTRLSPRPRR